MKSFKYILALFSYAYLVHSFEFAPGSIIFVTITPIVMIGSWVYRLYIDRQHLRTTPEDVIIVSLGPNGEELNLGEFQQYIRPVNYHKVGAELRRVQRVVEFNKWFDQKKHKNNSAKVHSLIFQHGQHIAEDWEQFTERVLQFVKNSITKRHSYLAKNYPAWYAEHLDYQTKFSYLEKIIHRLSD